MKNYDQNIANRLNRLKKRPKCQSSNTHYKTPSQISFQFKSSLFTEKNKSLIEKLVSLSVSPENSFSKEEESKEKDKEKIKKINKQNPTSANAKVNNIKTSNNSKIYNHHIFQNNNNYKKNVFCKKILKNKINSTFSYMNAGLNNIKNSITSITNCQIKPIKKIKYKIKISNNNSVEKKKIVFNGLGNKKIKNNSVKSKINSNLNSPNKYLYEKKKLNCSVRIGKRINIRNSVNKKNNNLNIITVKTINLKNRKNNINNLIENKKKTKILVNQKNRNTTHYH